MDRRAWTLLLSLAAIWGASYMFIKIGLRDLSPGVVAWMRVALAAVILVLVARWRGALRVPMDTWPLLAVLGAVQAAGPFMLIAAGQQEVSSGLAGILVASTPLFTALLAIRLDREERAEGVRLGGVLLGLAGVALLLGVDLGGTAVELVGGLMIVLASLGYAVGGFMVKHRMAGMPPTAIAAWVMVASTVLLAPVGIATLPEVTPGVGPLAAVAVLGVLGTGIAFVIFYDLMTTVGPARTFIVTYLAPAFAVAYGAALLDEPLTVSTAAGLALIVSGSYLAAEGRLPWRPREPSLPLPPVEACATASSDGAGR